MPIRESDITGSRVWIMYSHIAFPREELSSFSVCPRGLEDEGLLAVDEEARWSASIIANWFLGTVGVEVSFWFSETLLRIRNVGHQEVIQESPKKRKKRERCSR